MSQKQWCSSCTEHRIVATTQDGLICCTTCGKVVAEDMLRDEVSWAAGPGGMSQPSGSIVRSVAAEHSASRERTLDRAYYTITEMINILGVGDGDLVAKPAVRIYEIAVDKNFVRGRRADQVAAACLYLACREQNKPFLLIEFSEFLRVNVYVLGAVFLQLCKLLHLTEHPIVRKLVDPSLFIHRFAIGLLGKVNHEVQKTALHIMTSMKRDWMTTGRKPSGLCGAALYISALSHGLKCSKTEVVKVVHICEATLTKRLIEFEGTESGSLTIEEFNQKAKELENHITKHNIIKGKVSKEGELICEHKGSGEPYYAHGLCKACYDEFFTISGGLDGGSEPPAFQRAERERLANTCASGNSKNFLLDAEQVESICSNPIIENVTRLEDVGADQMETTRAAIEHGGLDGFEEISETVNDRGAEGVESDSFSDIDDAEVNAYLHNEEEAKYKKMIWEQVNWEYIEEQAQKAAAGVLNVSKPKKERQQKKTEGIKARTAAEAAHQILSKKRVSSKLNHDRLKELFDEPVASDVPKKSRTDGVSEKKNEGEYVEDEFDEYDEKNTYEDYQDNPYDYNEGCEDFDDGLF